MYMVKYMCMALYYVLIKKYLANFIGKKILSKIYSTYAIVGGIVTFFMGSIATIIVKNNDMKMTIVYFRLIAIVGVFFVVKFEEYSKVDSSFTEFKLVNELNN